MMKNSATIDNDGSTGLTRRNAGYIDKVENKEDLSILLSIKYKTKEIIRFH